MAHGWLIFSAVTISRNPRAAHIVNTQLNQRSCVPPINLGHQRYAKLTSVSAVNATTDLNQVRFVLTLCFALDVWNAYGLPVNLVSTTDVMIH